MTQGKYIAVPIKSLPGVDKDGTIYSSVNYTDSRWTRYFEKVPAKIGGYEAVSLGVNFITRNMFDVGIDEGAQVFLGRTNGAYYLPVSTGGEVSPEVNISPSGFAFHNSNTWSFDQFSASSTLITPGLTGSYLLAAATRNASAKNSSHAGQVYYTYISDSLYGTSSLLPLQDYGPTTLTPPLPPGPLITCSGGVLCSPSIVMVYGSNGVLQWSQPGTFDQWGYGTDDTDYKLNVTTISSAKVIVGALTPGATGISALFWTANSLERVSFVPNSEGTQLIPSTQTLQKGTSILSATSLVQYNQLFYWPGNGQFYFFNGIVNILPNNLSTNFFFDNLDYKNTGKIWTMVQPRFGEIWFCWPSNRTLNLPGSEDVPEGECDQAIVLQTIENTWYCTPLSRSAGVSPADTPYPLLADSSPFTTNIQSGPYTGYPIWQHDTGEDKVINNERFPINSYFDTHIMDLFTHNPEQDVLIRSRRLQPDFIQVGPMEVTIYTRMFPSDEPLVDGPYTFLPTTTHIDLETQQGALLNFRFRSNVLGGYFRLGKTILEYLPGDNVR